MFDSTLTEISSMTLSDRGAKIAQSDKLLKREVFSRGICLGAAALMPFTIAADTAIGLIAKSIFFSCRAQNIANNHLPLSRFFVAAPVFGLVMIINPKAEALNTHPMIADRLKDTLDNLNHPSLKTKSAVRAVITAGFVGTIAARVADTVAGFFLGIAAILTLGSSTKINSLAMSALQPTAILNDTIEYIEKMITPPVMWVDYNSKSV